MRSEGVRWNSSLCLTVKEQEDADMKRGNYQPMVMGIATSLGLLIVATLLHVQSSSDRAALPNADQFAASTR